MDIRVLKYFLAVAREENITKAAEALHISQPPLSRQIKDLEKELGKQLLIRGTKKITLTEDGILLRKRAEEIVDLIEKTKSELKNSDANISGDVYIGSGETRAVSFFAQAAEKLQKKYPMIRYNIYSGDAEHITERLDRGLIDFGLLVGQADMEKYDSLKLPIKDIWGILMRKDSELAHKEYICPNDLYNKNLIISHQSVNDKNLVSWFKTDFLKMNVVLKYDLLYNASMFVRKNFGYALALDGLANISEESELCFKPLYPAISADLYVVWKKNQVFSRASNTFICELRRIFS